MRIEGIPDELQLVPMMPPWPDHMPPAEARDGGTFLPAPLDGTVFRRLLFCDRYPELAQVALNAQAYVLQTRFEEQQITDALKADIALERAVRAAEIPPPPPPTPPSWTLPEILGVGAGGLVAGLLAGILLSH